MCVGICIHMFHSNCELNTFLMSQMFIFINNNLLDFYQRNSLNPKAEPFYIIQQTFIHVSWSSHELKIFIYKTASKEKFWKSKTKIQAKNLSHRQHPNQFIYLWFSTNISFFKDSFWKLYLNILFTNSCTFCL